MESSTIQTSNTSETHDTQSTNRAEVFGLVADGIAAGLPIPGAVSFYDTALNLRIDDNDADAVNQWTAYLGLPEATRTGGVHDLDTDRAWRSLSVSLARTDRMPGWYASVWCLVPATADERLEARAALMTAKLDQAEQILNGVSK